MANAPELQLSLTAFPVDPGGAVVAATLSVRNAGNVVDVIQLHVEGLDEAWVRLMTTSVSLMPGDQTAVQLVLQAPAGAAAGPHDFRIVGTSRADLAATTTIHAKLVVARLAGPGLAGMELQPVRQRVRGGESGSYAVTARNESNADLALRLVGTDPLEELTLQFDQTVLVIPVGGSASTRLRARPRHGRLTGPEREYEFTVSGVADEEFPLGAPLAVLSGQLVHAAGLPAVGQLLALPARRLLLGAAPLVLAAALVIWFVVGSAPRASGVPTRPTRTAGAQAGPQALVPASGSNTANGTPPDAHAPEATGAAPEVVDLRWRFPSDGAASALPFLSWQVLRAAETHLDYGNGAADAVGEAPVGEAPAGFGAIQRLVYTIVASNADGTSSRETTLFVIRPPVIRQFEAVFDPAINTTVLRWRADGAERVWLDGQLYGGAEGSVTVAGIATGDHVLRAANKAGESTRVVGVQEPPPAIQAAISSTPPPAPPTRSSLGAPPTATVTQAEVTTGGPPVPGLGNVGPTNTGQNSPSGPGSSPTATKTPAVEPTDALTPTVSVMSTVTQTETVSPTYTTTPTLKPTLTLTATPTRIATITPTATATSCPSLDTLKLTSSSSGGSVKVDWSASGGCSPYNGAVTANYTYAGFNRTYAISSFSGSLSDTPPTPGCGSAGVIGYTLTLRDRVGQTVNGSTSASTVTKVCPQASDTTPPTSSASGSPAPDASGNILSLPAIVTIQAVDNPGGSGVQSITYAVNGGPPQTVAATTTTVPIVNEGATQISFFATDNAGNREDPANSRTFTVNRPTLNVSLVGTGGGSVTSLPVGIVCPTTCTSGFDEGTTVTLMAGPDVRSVFAGWSGPDALSCVSPSPNTCALAVGAPRSVTATFNHPGLTVAIAGGGGAVSSTNNADPPPAITDCTSTCSANFDVGTNVTLNPTPNGSSGPGNLRFANWSGWSVASATMSSGVTRIQIAGNPIVTNLALRQIIIASGTPQAGFVDSSTHDATGTQVVVSGLSRPPSPGDQFSLGCYQFDPYTDCTVSVTMNTDEAITANFGLPLTVTLAGNGSGRVSSAPGAIGCDVTAESCLFPVGSQVVLTATQNAGSSFAGWSSIPTGACTVLSASPQVCTVTMNGPAIDLTATFSRPTLSVNIVGTQFGTGSGLVNSSPAGISCHNVDSSGSGVCSSAFDFASTAILTAQSSANADFLGWTGPAAGNCGTNRTCPIMMTADQSITATFVPQVLVVVLPRGPGTVQVSPGAVQGTCQHGETCGQFRALGSQVSFTETPDPGATFMGWTNQTPTGACSSTTAPTCTFTITESTSITAEFCCFGPGLFMVAQTDGAPDPGGSITVSQQGNIFTTPITNCTMVCTAFIVEGGNQGGTVRLTATANSARGFVFRSWGFGPGSGGLGTSGVNTLQVGSGSTQTSVTVSTAAGMPSLADFDLTGTVLTLTTGSDIGFPVSVTGNTAATIELATGLPQAPAPGDLFNISCGQQSLVCSLAVTMRDDESATAYFEPNPPATLIVRVEGVPLAAQPASAFAIGAPIADSTAGQVGAQGSPQAATRASGSVAISPDGVTCRNVCTAPFKGGTAVTLTAIPDKGSVFAGWSGAVPASCLPGNGPSAATCVMTLDQSRTITARFKVVWKVDVTVTGTGSVTTSPAGINCPPACSATFPDGALVAFSAQPDTSFTFAAWSGPLVPQLCMTAATASQPCNIRVTQSSNVGARFDLLVSPILNVTAGNGGSVQSTPAGINCPGACSMRFPIGSSVTLSAHADTSRGYIFGGWDSAPAGPCAGAPTCSTELKLGYTDRSIAANFVQTVTPTTAPTLSLTAVPSSVAATPSPVGTPSPAVTPSPVGTPSLAETPSPTGIASPAGTPSPVAETATPTIATAATASHTPTSAPASVVPTSAPTAVSTQPGATATVAPTAVIANTPTVAVNTPLSASATPVPTQPALPSLTPVPSPAPVPTAQSTPTGQAPPGATAPLNSPPPTPQAVKPAQTVVNTPSPRRGGRRSRR